MKGVFQIVGESIKWEPFIDKWLDSDWKGDYGPAKTEQLGHREVVVDHTSVGGDQRSGGEGSFQGGSKSNSISRESRMKRKRSQRLDDPTENGNPSRTLEQTLGDFQTLNRDILSQWRNHTEQQLEVLGRIRGARSEYSNVCVRVPCSSSVTVQNGHGEVLAAYHSMPWEEKVLFLKSMPAEDIDLSWKILAEERSLHDNTPLIDTLNDETESTFSFENIDFKFLNTPEDLGIKGSELKSSYQNDDLSFSFALEDMPTNDIKNPGQTASLQDDDLGLSSLRSEDIEELSKRV